ncbi:MAG: bifunctional phosphopantothenoylcysteine decarboxylase/phosphopantothenate--cysteine ligase CoaBC [Thalassobium sp.]|jgi:phosphopantothenoylcysteine decarboxylase/phosphopantothenate--cysteine ligase|uniref:Coenzyme A biosynthesis bifunctional protein CoaBC n=1 Tax=Thalassolituus pacificus TaxID=2975440 RepID=A0A9X2WG15_9GAMM|nr:bifunctional phosphopantothenoylcysteine decarboxylase/phosphopantothenate--cysteine ligase CoaBC [Thalassolituus pacificus]MCT7359067.1 bifunctional phosphopantothenoylcysteine decarboxylase/phosphopantothenate--cysteine ligase CoaBC [Thalassolituus pacificus]PHS65347.1 MAG: bifunctional phosphopantothenoylcysteine decarboxylase/phosphopantothenate--cysteine ligase CoaBC [Thalassobium sp.]
MQQLCNKRILLGITGGIAAYKAAELVRILKKAGAEVRVVMTAGAMEFITPLTLQALSGNPVHHALLDPEAEAGMGHIELAKWADLLLVAPASANFIARLTQGSGDDLLTTVCLATEAPIALAPAMNQAMWREPITQANIARLIDIKGSKLYLFGPAEGMQACGDVGPGRMLEPEEIAVQAADLFETGLLAGLNVVITAGPTREAIDPVRYISNHSSGKMGYAIAAAARDAGARVTLISGPVVIPAPERVHCLRVESARDMLDSALAQLGQCDIFIAAAAVADYRPMTAANQKIKKSADSMELTLVKNPDVVATVAAHEQRPFTVGFAAETQDVDIYARDKLVRKNLDMIVANDVSMSDIGFNSDQNAVTVFWAENQQSFAQMSKQALARELVELIAHQYQQTQEQQSS